MGYLSTLTCTSCGREFSPKEPQTICPHCNATLYAQYDIEKIKAAVDPEDFEGRRADMWRYFEFLPVSEQENIVSLGEGFTPLFQVRQLGKQLGLNELYVKDEGQNPTGTFKARGLAMAVSRAQELNLQKLAIPSAGNAAGALATYGAKAGLEIYVVMPKDAPKTCKIENYMAGANVFQVDGLISKCGEIIEQGKEKFGWFSVSTTKEPYRVEGKKTMGLEIAEQFEWELPDVILYPTGGGTGLIGMWKAFNELKEMGWIGEELPRMVSVQSKGCSPIVDAYKNRKQKSSFYEDAHTFAGGIRVPKAFADYLVLQAIYESNGAAVAVSDDHILESSKKLAQQGVFACPEGAATLAGLEKLIEQEEIDRNDQVVLFNTGTGLKYTETFAHHIDLNIPLIDSVEEIANLLEERD